MHRSEEDGLEELGWLIVLLAALGFLFGAIVFAFNWMGWLS